MSGMLYVRTCTSDRDCSLYAGLCTSYRDYGSRAAPAAYSMRPQFFVAEQVNDFPRPQPNHRLLIRIQPTGNQIEHADALIFNVTSVRAVAQQLGAPIPVGPSTNLRASLLLGLTCPAAEVTAELDGAPAVSGGITFSSFGSARPGAPVGDDFHLVFDDRLAARFSFDLVDRRALTLGGSGAVSSEPALAGHIDGDFDFRFARGRSGNIVP